MLYLCLFVMVCSLVGAYLLTCDKQKNKQIKRRTLYEIPSAFWDEYNTMILDIYYMSLANCESIRYKIEDFEYKYSQTVDYQIYNDRMSEILRNYKAKRELIINKTK
jgi:hypothetical protein